MLISCSRLRLPAGNESCPQPQTSEHLAAIEIMKLKHILILQNKIDLVKESQAKEQYEQILAFVQGESAWTCTAAYKKNITQIYLKEIIYIRSLCNSAPHHLNV